MQSDSNLTQPTLPPATPKSARSFLPKKYHLIGATIVAALVCVSFYGYQAADAYVNYRQIKGLLPTLQTALLNRDLRTSEIVLQSLKTNLDEVDGDISRLYPFNNLPIISRETKAARNIVSAGQIGIATALKVTQWAGEQQLLLEKTEKIDDLTDAQKKQLLAAVANSAPLWNEARAQLALATTLLKDAAQTTGLPVIKSGISGIDKKLSSANDLFTQFSPLIPLLPKLLGYPAPQTYLLLLQNNTELRPTGGFIGTFGSLALTNGKITQFQTENVYNLDEPAKAYNTKIPPDPIRNYLKQAQWFFRDVNWDPDFPTTAREAMRFYHEENGPVARFDGVFAFTPKLIEDLMAVTGPIIAGDTTFTAANLVDLLQYKVEVDFKTAGINIYNRKKIIDDVAQILKDKIMRFTANEWAQFIRLTLAAATEKQVMFYFTDPVAQAAVKDFNWDNGIRATDGDYFYVVDANLGSLKTDPAITRTIAYSLAPAENNSLQATLAITYKNSGEFDWKTTRYRTYTRLYVPFGSSLIKAKGNEEPISISDQHGKTVFGTFISIEPGDEETLTFTYKLPARIASLARAGQYNLLAQKQGGTAAHKLLLDLTMPFNLHTVEPKDILRKEEKNEAAGEWNLSVDRSVSLTGK